MGDLGWNTVDNALLIWFGVKEGGQDSHHVGR